jgi:membrane peptidoglycan carboxypeptidase
MGCGRGLGTNFKTLYPTQWTGVTPIQLANMMATVANEGYYYTPHIIKKK